VLSSSSFPEGGNEGSISELDSFFEATFGVDGMLESSPLENSGYKEDFVDLTDSKLINAGSGKIPHSPTSWSDKGYDCIMRQYEYTEPGSDLRTFLDEHCSHLYKSLREPDVVDTGFDQDFLQKKFFDNPDESLVEIGTKYSIKYQPVDIGKCYVYCFYDPDTQQFEIGSSVNGSVRLRNHYQDFNNGEVNEFYKAARKYEDGLGHYYWSPVVECPDYVEMYQREHGYNPLARKILQCHSQYECRIYEQALISYHRPSLNSWWVDVKHGYYVWNESEPSGEAHQRGLVTIPFTEDGERLEPLPSVKQAAQFTGISEKKVRSLAINPIEFHPAPKLAKIGICFEIPSLSREEPEVLADLTGFDMNLVPEGKFALVSPDKRSIIGDFMDTVEDVAEALGVKNFAPWRCFINKEYLVTSLVHCFAAYIVANEPASLLPSRSRVAKEVWAYPDVGTPSEDNHRYFPSLKVAAKSQKVSRDTLKNKLDQRIPQRGWLYFSTKQH
jgi:hypothetical protein